jgi:DeoR family transcriptional regulator, aga operon transcriptional repressor
MRQEDRLGVILERLNAHGTVGVGDLSKDLGVSLASVRRDLQLLEDQHLLSRTHGGAVSSGVLYELPMRYRGGRHQEEKRLIAAAAGELVADGVVSVALSGGTTTTEVARVLATRSGLKVVTNAINIAAELALRPQIGLVVCGGSARPESHELVGPLAEETLSHLNVDIAFVGVDGITAAAGLTTHHEVEAATNRAMIRIAARVVVVTDGSKVGKQAFAQIARVVEINDLITDSTADPAECSRLQDAGVHIITV